jgi:hypothetical protein
MLSSSVKPSKIRLYTSIPEDLKTFFYKEPILNKFKSKTSYINKTNLESTRPKYQLVSKTDPIPRAPYGISKQFDTTKEETDRKTLNLTIECESLFNVLQALDEHNIKVAFENSEKWFNKKLSIDNIRFMYKPLVVPSTKGYSPTFKVKLNTNKQFERATRFFVLEETSDGKMKYVEKDYTVIKQGCRCVPNVEISSMWFNTNQFGMILEATELIVFPTEQREEFPFQWGDSNNNPNNDNRSSLELKKNSEEEEQEQEEEVNHNYVPPVSPSS